MSLHSHTSYYIPIETARVAKVCFPKGHPVQHDTGTSRVGLQTPPLTKGMLSAPLEPQYQVPRPKNRA